MTVLKLSAAFILGMLLMSAWFGLSALLTGFFRRHKMETLLKFRSLLAALIPTAAVLMLSSYFYLNASSMNEWKYWLISTGIAAAASWIVSFSAERSKTDLSVNAVFQKALDGILMEVPMRLMMQTFVWLILDLMDTGNVEYYGIVINGLIWCSGILIQNRMSKGKRNSRMKKELTASFLFSLGAGWLLAESNFFVFPMIAHALERIFSIGWKHLFQKRNS